LETVRRREQLLVLDNFEHLLTAAPIVVDLLAAGPGLRILVTSREALRLRGEHDLVVSPLALPEQTRPVGHRWLGVQTLATSPAVTLFLQRARAARSEFILSEANAADVAAICARLDGLPHAIELAAARVGHLSPGAILERIDRQRSARFSLLTGGPRDAPARLRTMREAIAWSHDLLDDAECDVFRRLAVFVGGFTLDAAAAVCELDELTMLDKIGSLVSKSLVRYDGDLGEPRYRMLETIREFGQERLAASGLEESVRERHAEWCLALAERVGPLVKHPDAAGFLEALEREHPNLRAALTWFKDQSDGPRLTRLTGALWSFWEEHAHYAEGRRWLEVALELGHDAPAQDRFWLLTGSGTLARHQTDFRHAIVCHGQALTLARELGDREAEAFALNNLGVQAMELGDFDEARTRFEACIAVVREANAPHLLTRALHNLGQIQRVQHDSAAAVQSTEEVLALAREHHIGWLLPIILVGLGLTTTDLGDYDRAIALFHESLSLAQARGNLSDVIDGIEGLARVAAATGQAERATRLFGSTDALREELATPFGPTELAYLEPVMNTLRDTLGANGFSAAWEEGRSLSRQDAIEAALTVRVEPAKSETPTAGRQPAPHGLTGREREVLRLLVEGRSDKEIGAVMSISSQTATKHVGNLLRKLDVPSRTAAAILAVRRGYV
ncbi:MAG: tetratricopeptide repeat protein, partial [Chloroflexi bacterium]|nr:tetratricopeptide repeat protein [Chloroflexota bacterium]